MEYNNVHSNESIDNLSVDELVDLKMEVDDLISDLDDIIEECDETLHS